MIHSKVYDVEVQQQGNRYNHTTTNHIATETTTTLQTSTGVDAVFASNDEATKEFLKLMKHYIHQQWQMHARKQLLATGIADDILTSIVVSDNAMIVSSFEECVSPVRKKQKSNDHVKQQQPQQHRSSSNYISKQKSKVGITTTTSINHGLSKYEIDRIRNLKKIELIKELDFMGGEYNKNWSKAALYDALLQTYALINIPPTQTFSKTESTIADEKISDIDNNQTKETKDLSIQRVESEQSMNHSGMQSKEVARSSADAKNNHHNRIIDVQHNKNSNTNNNILVLCDDGISVSSKDDNIAQQQKKTSIMDVDEVNGNVIEVTVSNDMDDIEEYETAKECYSQSQSNNAVKQYTMTKPFVPTLSSVTGSGVKPRISPTTVPVGIVDSAKKLLLSNQKQQQQPPTQPPKAIPFPSLMSSSNMTHSMEQKHENSCTTSSNYNISGVDRILSTPAFSNNAIPTGIVPGKSKALQANLEARQGRIAQIKELSKKNATQLSSSKSGMKYINNIYPLSSNKNDLPSERIAEIRTKHFDRHLDQPTRPIGLAMNANTYISATVDTIKKKSPLQTIENNVPVNTSAIPTKIEFVCYEMTDGEYDSDDDDNSEQSRKKMIPDWARTAQLKKALEIQYSPNFSIDADVLFGEVETCNLEAIFNTKSSRYRVRNSSGDWTKDRVTAEEKRRYKLQIAAI